MKTGGKKHNLSSRSHTEDDRTKDNRVKSDRAEIEILRTKISDLIHKKSVKAAIILAGWLKPPESLKRIKK